MKGLRKYETEKILKDIIAFHAIDCGKQCGKDCAFYLNTGKQKELVDSLFIKSERSVCPFNYLTKVARRIQNVKGDRL